MYTLDLDLVVANPANAKAEALSWLADLGLTNVLVTVLEVTGPGGGWPLVRFTSDDKADMEALANKYWPSDPDMVEAAKANW